MRTQVAALWTRSLRPVALLLTVAASFPALAITAPVALRDPLPGILPRDHPAASGGERYRNARPIEERVKAPSANVQPAGLGADAVVGFDLLTRREDRLSATLATRPAWFRHPAPQTSPGFRGYTPVPENGIPGLGLPFSDMVFGDDDRVPVEDTTAWPFRTVCKLYMTFPFGEYIGSGILVGDKYVLTAGHCAYDADMGFPLSIEVVPGKTTVDGKDFRPYGSAFVRKIYCQVGWLRDAHPYYDYAVLTLDRKIGLSTGWLGYAYRPAIDNVNVTTAGFPGDINNGETMITTSGPIEQSNALELFFHIDVMGGQSGSGMWVTEGDNYNVVGIVAYSSPNNNWATRIDTARFSWTKKLVGLRPSP